MPLVANSSTSYFKSSNISRAQTSARSFQLTIASLCSIIRQGGSPGACLVHHMIFPECFFRFCSWCCVAGPASSFPLAVSCTHTCIPYPLVLYEGLDQWESCGILLPTAVLLLEYASWNGAVIPLFDCAKSLTVFDPNWVFLPLTLYILRPLCPLMYDAIVAIFKMHNWSILHVLCYLDDILLTCCMEKEHLINLEEMLCHF